MLVMLFLTQTQNGAATRYDQVMPALTFAATDFDADSGRAK